MAVGGNLVHPAAIAAAEFWRLTDTARQLFTEVQKGRGAKSP
ncbi:MAG TPA: hypothetical protein VFL17_02285 [Anaerolineae bacterium]|nr:hypothetical protein [Anaerolineae bacterium]